VFTKNQQVSRRLSVQELADCYDLPRELSVTLKSQYGDHEVERLPFPLATLIKILWTVVNEVLRDGEAQEAPKLKQEEKEGGVELPTKEAEEALTLKRSKEEGEIAVQPNPEESKQARET
jgi:hypothetical protein